VLVISTIAGTIVFLSAQWLATNLFDNNELKPLIAITGLTIPLESVNQCLSAVFRGLRQFRLHVLAHDLVRNVALLGCFLFGLTGHLDLITVFCIIAAGTGLGSLVSLFMVNIQLNLRSGLHRDIEIFRQIFLFSYLLFFVQVLQTLSHRLMVVISGGILAASQVGVLAVVMRFLNVLDFARTAFSRTTYVEFTRFHYLRNYEGLNGLLQNVSLVLLAACLAIGLPLIMNSGMVMSFFGIEYAPYGWALVILLSTKLVTVGTGPMGQILIACGKRKTVFGISAVDVAMQFLFVVPMMMVFGLAGAVYGNACRMLSLLAARHISLYTMVGVYSVTRSLLSLLLSAFAASALGISLIRMTEDGGWQWGITLMIVLFLEGLLIYTFYYTEPAAAQTMHKNWHWIKEKLKI
jgi:O-antigen/teichoic acid export membrane protein